MGEKEKYTLVTFRSLNKPIYFMGLSPIYLMILFFVLMALLVFIKWMAIPFVIVTVAVLGRLAKEQKKGSPDILFSWQVRFLSKKRYTDQSFLLKYLKNE